jgi:hypothetical protein
MQRFVDDEFVDYGFVERIHDDFASDLDASAAISDSIHLTMHLDSTLAANATIGATLSIISSTQKREWMYHGIGYGIPINR